MPLLYWEIKSMFSVLVHCGSHCWSHRTFPHFKSNSLVTEFLATPLKDSNLCLNKSMLCATVICFTKKKKSGSDFFLSLSTSRGSVLVTNRLLCDLQVLISHAETKDGSGGPGDYDDSEHADVLPPKDLADLGRVFTEPIEQPSVIVVRQWTYCDVSVTAALYLSVKVDHWPLII